MEQLRNEQSKQIDSKKRGIEYLRATELQWKLQSKADFYNYLDKHRKYFATFAVTSL